uniref:BTB domain-containing protein n=2 Tax=Sinocyclocheilus rhinocerous TaxID=307959 RepID=A0A673FE41_9TELE
MIRIHNPHHVPFLHQTEQLRQAGTLCDTLLTVEGLTFKAHALILALASKRLKRQLTNQHGPGPRYCCIIDRVSSHTFKQILDYVYSESLEVPKDDLEELLKGAEYLEVESLVEQCQAQLRDPDSPTKTDTKVANSLRDDKAQKDTELSKRSHNLDEDHLDCSSEEERSSTKKSVHHAHKKSCSPVSPLPPMFSRETIISSSAQSPTPRLCWPPVSPSRSMVLNCREIMTFHSLRAYPYPTPMYPFLHHSLQPQVSSSLMGYTGLLHPYHPLIHSAPLTQDNPFIPGLKGKTTSISTALTVSMSEDQER